MQALAVIGFPEHPEPTGQTVGQRVPGVGVCRDRQTDRRGRSRVRRTVHAPPEALPQHSRHQGQDAGAPNQIEPGDLAQVGFAVVETVDQRAHSCDRLINQRGDFLVEGGHWHRD